MIQHNLRRVISTHRHIVALPKKGCIHFEQGGNEHLVAALTLMLSLHVSRVWVQATRTHT